MAISGNTIVVSRIYSSTNDGLYFFENDGSQWTQVHFHSTGPINPSIASLSLSGNVAVLGLDSVEISVFERGETTWTKTQTITGNSSYKFGASVTTDGTYILTSELGWNGGNRYYGRVHMYKHNGTNWSSTKTFYRPGGHQQGAQFGSQIAINGNNLFRKR